MSPTINFSALKHARQPTAQRPMAVIIVIVTLFFAGLIYLDNFVPQSSAPSASVDPYVSNALGSTILAALFLGVMIVVLRQKKAAQYQAFANFAEANGWEFQPQRSFALEDSPLADLFSSPSASIWYQISGTTTERPFQLCLLQGYRREPFLNRLTPLYYTMLILPPNAQLAADLPEQFQVRNVEDATYLMYEGNAVRPDDVRRLFEVGKIVNAPSA